MNFDDVKVRVKSLVAEIVEKDEKDLGDNVSFVEDLGLDSLKALEILAAIEKEFKIEIPEEKLTELTTVNKAVEIAYSAIN